ncbi:uracil-DNA glycosylase family protein [Azospirillum sp. TSO5]|uniref:uracil-DNA glycosylase family protein n=1 Tax=Azospirillum sp. TSO5 TaxID=716760 RepID=UPI0011B1D8B1|nr:uracil-DNA glycosylase family protein [Azospirillum sp. TSO5]
MADFLVSAIARSSIPGDPLSGELEAVLKAVENLDAGKVLTSARNRIAEIGGTGALTRLSKLLGVETGRFSNWMTSGKAPNWVAAMLLLMALYATPQEADDGDDISRDDEAEQQAQDDSLKSVGSAGSAAAGITSGLAVAGALAGPVGWLALGAFPLITELIRTKKSSRDALRNGSPLKTIMQIDVIEPSILGQYLNNEKIVPPVITDQARIVFIGDSPGKWEMLSRRPFSGNASSILRDMIELYCDDNNIERDRIGYTNIFLSPPDGGSISGYFDRKSKETEFIQKSTQYGYVKKENVWSLAINAKFFKDAKPAVIVPLGSVALWGVLGRSDIANMRGSTEDYDFGSFKTTVAPTLHPAYVIRDRRREADFIHDIRQALDIAFHCTGGKSGNQKDA